MAPKKATKRKASPAKVTYVVVYKDDGNEYRWSAKTANGKVVADSGEGYNNRSYAMRMARDLYPDVEVEWVGSHE